MPFESTHRCTSGLVECICTAVQVHVRMLCWAELHGRMKSSQPMEPLQLKISFSILSNFVKSEAPHAHTFTNCELHEEWKPQTVAAFIRQAPCLERPQSLHDMSPGLPFFAFGSWTFWRACGSAARPVAECLSRLMAEGLSVLPSLSKVLH